jgi:Alkylmercury lyase
MAEPTLAQRMRLSIFNTFVDRARPPVVEELMHEFELSRDDVEATLDELISIRAVAVVKGTHRILMAWPFSAIATPFVVQARGHDYFANCSWDAIAFHAMLDNEPVDIDSFCQHCAEPIRIELRGGKATRVDPGGTQVYLALRPTQWWEDIITTCSNTMVFFAGPDHRDASALCAPAEQAASLTPDQAHRLSIPLYGGRLSIDYERPGGDELNAHFARLGLTGPYWHI